jgi:hypothetical protein
MSLEAEREMWEAIASQPSPAVRCDRCGRELGTGLPSPCSRCAPAGMSRGELDSLTVRMDGRGRIELVNSGGLVGRFVDRDAAYAEVRRLRGLS